MNADQFIHLILIERNKTEHLFACMPAHFVTLAEQLEACLATLERDLLDGDEENRGSSRSHFRKDCNSLS